MMFFLDFPIGPMGVEMCELEVLRGMKGRGRVQHTMFV